MFDIVIVGAGISGLVCAQQLHQVGYKVLVVEKSRGLGGRVATRRLHETCADLGTCYLNPKDELLQRFVELLVQQNILQIWTDTTYEFDASLQQLTVRRRSPIYTASKGMSAIARFLAVGLEIQLNQRVVGISTVADNWCLQLEATNATTQITAKAVVVAIPAPQALTLLEPIAVLPTFLANLRSVEFASCISVIAGYPSVQSNFDWQAVTVVDDDNLAWIGLDSSKRAEKRSPVFVLHSSAQFARNYLETTDLQPIGQQLLNRAAEYLLPWLKTPEWMQVHRWRYAFPTSPLIDTCLKANTPQPLVCCGDWCGGNLVTGAMQSGISAAEQINRQMSGQVLPGNSFLDKLAATKQ